MQLIFEVWRYVPRVASWQLVRVISRSLYGAVLDMNTLSTLLSFVHGIHRSPAHQRIAQNSGKCNANYPQQRLSRCYALFTTLSLDTRSKRVGYKDLYIVNIDIRLIWLDYLACDIKLVRAIGNQMVEFCVAIAIFGKVMPHMRTHLTTCMSHECPG